MLIISLSLSLVGLTALFFLKPEVSPQQLQIEGVVKNVWQKDNVAFIRFVPDNLTVVSFDQLDIEPGDHVLNGRLQQYNGRVEFVVEGYD